MKIVITGTTCAGKSTTLDLLKDRGFEIVPETALEIIKEQTAIGGDILPNKDVIKFQEVLLERQLEKEKVLSSEKNYFLDRSIIDQFGYCNFYKIEAPKEVLDLAKSRYDKVFLLEPLDFVDDRFEYEDREAQLAIDKEIRKAYEFFNYDYVLVPLDKPERRVDFILEKLNLK